MIAVKNEDIPMVKLLLHHGARVDEKSLPRFGYGEIINMLAIAKGDLLNILLSSIEESSQSNLLASALCDAIKNYCQGGAEIDQIPILLGTRKIASEDLDKVFDYINIGKNYSFVAQYGDKLDEVRKLFR